MPPVRQPASRPSGARRLTSAYWRRDRLDRRAHLSPALAPWLRASFGIEATALRELGLRDAEDAVTFRAAREAGAVLMSKDSDFVDLLSRHGPPSQVVWLTCGNTTNAALREVLTTAWPQVAKLLAAGEPLVEISGRAI